MNTKPATVPGKLEVYLFFNGRCDEALQFYQRVLGAKVVMLMRFKDSPDPTACAPGAADKVMHATFQVGDINVMASDGRCTGEAKFEGFALSMAVPTPEEADRVFADLGEGGKVHMPLAQTFFSPRFGMVEDKFGVLWMIIVRP